MSWLLLNFPVPEVIISQLEKIAHYMADNDCHKRVWLTETGYSTFETSNGNRQKRYTVSEYQQAVRLPRLYLLCLSLGLDKVFWYNLRSREININDREDHFGLVHKDLTPKPAFFSYCTLTHFLPNGSLRPKLYKLPNAYLCIWTNPDNVRTAAIWAESKISSIDIRIKGNYSIVDYLGNPVNGRITEIGNEILYISSFDRIGVNGKYYNLNSVIK